MHAEIDAFWKILAQQSVGVLVGAALPWAVRFAEIDLDASVDLQACVLSHLSSLIPRQRPTKLRMSAWTLRDKAENRTALLKLPSDKRKRRVKSNVTFSGNEPAAAQPGGRQAIARERTGGSKPAPLLQRADGDPLARNAAKEQPPGRSAKR